MPIATPQFFGLEPVKSLSRVLGFKALCPALGQFDREILLVSTAALRHAESTRDVTSIRNAHGWFTTFTDVTGLSRQKPTARSLNNQTRLMEDCQGGRRRNGGRSS